LGVIEREYISDAYAENGNKIKDLSLLIGNDGFSFAIFSGKAELIALRAYRFTENDKLEDCLASISQDQLLKSLFRKCSIGTNSKSSALIPSKLYDNRFPERYLDPSPKEISSNTEMIWIDEVKVLDGKNVHSVSIKLKNQLSDYFPGATFKHRNSVLIESFANKNTQDCSLRIYIHINKSTCQTFFFNENSLMTSGDFEFKSPDDFLYYVLLIFQSHDLNPEEVPLFISGALDAKSLIFNKLYRYIRNINWSEPDPSFELGDYPNNHLIHRDYELFALAL